MKRCHAVSQTWKQVQADGSSRSRPHSLEAKLQELSSGRDDPLWHERARKELQLHQKQSSLSGASFSVRCVQSTLATSTGGQHSLVVKTVGSGGTRWRQKSTPPLLDDGPQQGTSLKSLSTTVPGGGGGRGAGLSGLDEITQVRGFTTVSDTSSVKLTGYWRCELDHLSYFLTATLTGRY